jgi:hypothetical protein
LATNLADTGSPDVYGPFVSFGNNLIGNGTGSTGFGATDLVGTSSLLDPKLGPLEDNGGPTFTMAPLTGSPAVDGGTTSHNAPSTDQRGAPRVGFPDIGALEAQPLHLNPTTLPDGTVGTPYNQTFTVTGGAGHVLLTVTNVSTSIPDLLIPTSHVDNLTISGTPDQAGIVSFNVVATDSTGASTGFTYLLTINPAFSLGPNALPDGLVGTPYNQTITANAGIGDKTLTVANLTGVIPGLTIPSGGAGALVISGTPTAAGTVSFTVTATDVVGATVSQNYSFSVATIGAVDLTRSIVSLAPSTIGAGGTTTVTVTARDSNGNQEVSGGLAVVFGLGSGAVNAAFSAVTDNYNGTYTAMLTAKTVGTVSITCTIGGQPVTSTSPLLVITLASPSGAIATLMPTFVWFVTPGASRYEIYVSDLTSGQIQDQMVTAASLTQTTPLISGHSYRWWTRALFSGGSVRAWSSPTDFTVALPGPTAPGNTVSTVVPAFTWSGVTGVAQYEIYISDLTESQVQDLTVSGIGWTPATPLVSGHSYRWWVRAVGSSGPGVWSSALDFTVALPTLIGPTDTTGNVMPTFSWTGVDGVTQYEIWVSDRVTGSVQDLTVSGFTWTPTAPLLSGHSYRWWVRALGGACSKARVFKLGPPA